MDDRYSYAKEGPTPCNICGSNVREQLAGVERRLGGVAGSPIVKRVCLSDTCPSNTGMDDRLTLGV